MSVYVGIDVHLKPSQVAVSTPVTRCSLRPVVRSSLVSGVCAGGPACHRSGRGYPRLA